MILKFLCRLQAFAPFVLRFFKKLKTHFNTCFKKNHQMNMETSSAVAIDTNTGSFSTHEINYSQENFDFSKNKWKCQFCNNYYKDLKSKCYANHLRKEHSDKSVSDFTQLINENFFSTNTVPALNADMDIEFVGNSQWLQNLKELVVDKRFNVLHININSILGSVKLISIQKILDALFIDILCVQETKIVDDTPDSHFEHTDYNIFRRDRHHGGGGLLIYVKKCFNILSSVNDADFETITLALRIKNNITNFIFSYNPHFEHSNEFLSHIEERIKSLPPCRPIFIIGDFNQDLLSSRSDNLKSLMLDYNFSTLIDSPTHFMGDSASSIDVLFFNTADSVVKSTVVPCPFSNHEFILSTLNFETSRSMVLNYVNTRILNECD